VSAATSFLRLSHRARRALNADCPYHAGERDRDHLGGCSCPGSAPSAVSRMTAPPGPAICRRIRSSTRRHVAHPCSWIWSLRRSLAGPWRHAIQIDPGRGAGSSAEDVGRLTQSAPSAEMCCYERRRMRSEEQPSFELHSSDPAAPATQSSRGAGPALPYARICYFTAVNWNTDMSRRYRQLTMYISRQDAPSLIC
jgi:hypothetical protein